jgi:hypothetical protein
MDGWTDGRERAIRAKQLWILSWDSSFNSGRGLHFCRLDSLGLYLRLCSTHGLCRSHGVFAGSLSRVLFFFFFSGRLSRHSSSQHEEAWTVLANFNQSLAPLMNGPVLIPIILILAIPILVIVIVSVGSK